MAVYVTSDLHLGHRNIHKFRTNFSSPEENTEVLIDGILSTVNKKDTLYVLGDVIFSESGLYAFMEVASRISNVQIILGNHCTETNARLGYVAQLDQMFSTVKVHGMTKYKRKGYSKAWMTHAPIHPIELRGAINIHGHTHNQIIPDVNYFNACPENNDYVPVDVEDVLAGYRGTLFDEAMKGQAEVIKQVTKDWRSAKPNSGSY